MEITANAVQLVGVGQNVLFTNTSVKGNKDIVHKDGSGLTTLKGRTCQCFARYLVSFGANIEVPTGATAQNISLSISINGEPVSTSLMEVTPTEAESFFNVSRSLYITVPQGCCDTLTVENTSLIPIDVRNATLIVTRVV